MKPWIWTCPNCRHWWWASREEFKGCPKCGNKIAKGRPVSGVASTR